MRHVVGFLLTLLALAPLAGADARAEPIGQAFEVTLGPAYSRAVAGLEDGGFVTAWSDRNGDLVGRRYAADGSSVGNTFTISTTTGVWGGRPSIAALRGGGFVVGWEKYIPDASGSEIFAQRFSASGTRVGTEFQVNTYASNDQRFADVKGLNNGGFVFVWRSKTPDGQIVRVKGQIFSATGARVGPEFSASARLQDQQDRPSVAVLANGNFIVAWRGDHHVPTRRGRGVYAQLFRSSGVRIGTEFRVNAIDDFVDFPRMAALSDATIVLTWQAFNGTTYNQFARLILSNASPVGAIFRIPRGKNGSKLAALKGGQFIAMSISSTLRLDRFKGNRLLSSDQIDASDSLANDGPAVAPFKQGSEFVAVWHERHLYGQRFRP
jgi:hypothetical protein